MRFSIYSALLVVPLAVAVQFYPADTYAEVGENGAVNFFLKKPLSFKKQLDSNPAGKAVELKKAALVAAQIPGSKRPVQKKYKVERIRLIRGKKSIKCMSFISFLSLLRGGQ